ncbi:MAG TPA: C1 family peptidase, partial [Methanomicrobiales archaeon]|nr:C1 family peptidase [Methanomicrobiales archaeon]
MKERRVFILAILILAAFLVQVAWAAEEQAVSGNGYTQLKKADVNPDFSAYLAEKSAGTVAAATVEGRRLGFIPPPVDLQYLQGKSLPRGSFVTQQATGVMQALLSKYDLRTAGRVTPVKDQDGCGDCWAFATFGSLESYFKSPQTVSLDFSESDLNANSGFSVGSCNGGNQFMSTAYLSRWSGPIFEGGTPGTAVKHVQDVTFIPARASSSDNTNIKNAIYSTAGIYSAFYYTSGSYNPKTYSYYYSGRSASNHAITLVGWDDNYAKSNFKPAAPGNGAFIAKNSWGTAWGQSGYFYISYYDARIGKDNALFTGEPTTNYNAKYQYDPLGWVTSYGCSATTGWFANVFPSTGGKLAAVSFYSAMTNSPYAVWVYANPTIGNPVSGTLAYTGTGTITTPGYHTVKLTSPVTLPGPG